jgi:hypothetical protein
MDEWNIDEMSLDHGPTEAARHHDTGEGGGYRSAGPELRAGGLEA